MIRRTIIPRGRAVPLLLRTAAAFVLVGAGSGCVSGKYRMAPKDTLPPGALHLRGASNASDSGAAVPIETVVNTVIIYGGPGSWKRNAYWDEYVVSVANHGDRPVIVEAASLVDFQGESSSPGEDPWALEKVSQSWWKRARSSQSASLLALGAGTVVSAGVVTAAAMSSIMSGGAAAGGAAAGAAGVTVVALPIYAVTIVAINHHNKKAVAAEFARRRLVLPRVIEPGQAVQGSFFFRISPGPRQLILSSLHGQDRATTLIDLAPLATLHLDPTKVKPEGMVTARTAP